MKTFRFKIESVVLHEARAEDEDDLRRMIDEGDYGRVVDNWSGPDAFDIEEFNR